MNGFLDTWQYFHFIRPWWLMVIPAALFFWWRIRQKATVSDKPPLAVAPHLYEALTVGERGRVRFKPVDVVVITVVILALAVAGPTSHRVPNPLVTQTAPLAIALAVSKSMESSDIAPSRLERAKYKLLDITALRAGAKTGLVAYAQSAHRVVPLTEDPAVLKPFIEGLEPRVMPADGRNAPAALKLAASLLESETTPGAILFLLDELNPVDLSAFKAHIDSGGADLLFLTIGSSESTLRGLNQLSGANVIQLTPDNADIEAIERKAASVFREAASKDDQQQWDDRGWLLIWPALLLTLFYFRRGWTMRWGTSIILLALMSNPQTVKAEGLADWFFTPDQQGRMAFEDLRFGDAGVLFEDPMWKGYALYENGDYLKAAEVYSLIATAEAAFAEGMAHVGARNYRDGIEAFKVALERDPTHENAARNLKVTEAILAYLEKLRGEQDTGSGSEGADEVVFDKESKEGFKMEVTEETKQKMQTAEQWMRSVDTRTGDFLRSRFLLESTEQNQ